MARPLRIEYPGAVYHVTSRGNERKAIFKSEVDKDAFLKVLRSVNKRYNWICHAYCLMDNHYHLLIETPDGNLSRGMRQLNGVYTQIFNKQHSRVGHLLQGRYKAILVEKERHLLEVCRYVVLNPVRARIVEMPEQWKWSSYMGTADKSKCHPALTSDWILRQFGLKRNEAEAGYREFVRSGIGGKNIWGEVRAQCVLGESTFMEEVVLHVKSRENIPDISKPERFLNRPDIPSIFTPEVLNRKSKRNDRIVEAIRMHGYTQREVANYLNLHFTTISRILRGKCS